jgi:hypothetical protein
MIVRPASDALHLITQPDHAALAGRIMHEWSALSDHPRRRAILQAVAEHDNGWAEPDAAPIVDPATGRIADFISIAVHIRQEVWPRGVSRLSGDPWAAALVAEHAVFVYSRFRGDPQWTSFFAGMEAARAAHVTSAGRDMETLQRDYDFVRLGDLISLVFCTAWTEPQSHGGYTVSREGARVTVVPDAFGGRELAFEIPALEVPQRRFESDEHLRRALAAAPRVVLRGSVGA